MDQSKSDYNAKTHPVCAFHFVQRENTLAGMEKWTDRARTRMKELGITQEALAEKFNMTPAGMQKWLSGARQPSLDEINEIADHLKVSRTWLTHGILMDSTIDGLSTAAQNTLRRLIAMERSTPMPTTFWAAIESMAYAVSPTTTDSKRNTADDRTGTSG